MSLRPEKVSHDDLENIAVSVQFEDGSVGNLLYLTQGGVKVPKEFLELFGGGKTAQLNNFESLALFNQDNQKTIKAMRADKGQKSELEALIQAVKTGGPMPIPIESLFDTTLTTLAAMKSVRIGNRVDLATYWDTP
jgi:hypothetical protein